MGSIFKGKEIDKEKVRDWDGSTQGGNKHG